MPTMNSLKTVLKCLLSLWLVLLTLLLTPSPRFVSCHRHDQTSDVKDMVEELQEEVEILGNEQELLSDQLEQLSSNIGVVMDNMDLQSANAIDTVDQWPYLKVLSISANVLPEGQRHFSVSYWLSSAILDTRELWRALDEGTLTDEDVDRTQVDSDDKGVVYSTSVTVPATVHVSLTIILTGHHATYSISMMGYELGTNITLDDISLTDMRILNKDDLTPDSAGNLDIHIQTFGQGRKKNKLEDVAIQFEYLNKTTNKIDTSPCSFKSRTGSITCKIKPRSLLRYRDGLDYVVRIEPQTDDVKLMGFVSLGTSWPHQILEHTYTVPIHVEGQSTPYPSGYLDVKMDTLRHECRVGFDDTSNCYVACAATGTDIHMTVGMVLPDNTTEALTPSFGTSVDDPMYAYQQKVYSQLQAPEMGSERINKTYSCAATGAGGAVEEKRTTASFYREVEFVPSETSVVYNETTITLTCTLLSFPPLDLDSMLITCINDDLTGRDDVVVVSPDEFTVDYDHADKKFTVTSSKPTPDGFLENGQLVRTCAFICQRPGNDMYGSGHVEMIT